MSFFYSALTYRYLSIILVSQDYVPKTDSDKWYSQHFFLQFCYYLNSLEAHWIIHISISLNINFLLTN